MENKNNRGHENTEKQGNSKVQTLLFETKEGKQVKIECTECEICTEIVPIITEPCADCGTPYEHWRTIEIEEGEEKGFLHFIYRCSGCVGNKRKAQKILKPISREVK